MLIASPVPAQTAVAGDEILLHDTHFFLWGAYAPPADGRCADGWPAGAVARDHLAKLIRGRTVVCEPRGGYKAGNRLAICKAGDEDLASSMVRDGLAWARLNDDNEYVMEEGVALAGFAGLHAHDCRDLRLKSLSRRRAQ